MHRYFRQQGQRYCDSSGATGKTVAPAIWSDGFSSYICPPNSKGCRNSGSGAMRMRERGRSFLAVHANVAQLVEQLICNQQVGGSNPSIGSVIGTGEIPKWPTGADCKSAASQLHRFESCSPHHFTRSQTLVAGAHRTPRYSRGSSSVGRASAFQAECRGFESRLPLYARKARAPREYQEQRIRPL